MLVALTTLMLQSSTTPKTFEDLELDKITAYHNLKDFREEMDIEVGDAKIHRTTMMDGDRSHIICTLSDGTKMESVCDGIVGWAILHSQKQYFERKIDRNATFDPKQFLLKTVPDSFNFNFNGGQPVQFALSPAFEITSVETIKDDGETLRKVVATSKKPNGHYLTLTQWFLPDRWLVKRFTIDGVGNDGPIRGRGEATKLRFDAKYTSPDFALDSTLIQGYQKVEGGESASCDTRSQYRW